MHTEYLKVVEDDVELYAAIEDSLSKLQRLNPIQIEKLVFYLKSLYTYYPKSENLVEYCVQFDAKLAELRNLPEQIDLDRRMSSALFKGIGVCLLSGVILVGALLAALDGRTGLAVGIVIASGAVIAYAHDKWFNEALKLFAEKDRWFFLSAIRAARACNELEWAGLFTYKLPKKSDQPSHAEFDRDHVEVGRLTAELRAALYNDEYFRYSPPELSVFKHSDA